jgi:hypothetical protein
LAGPFAAALQSAFFTAGAGAAAAGGVLMQVGLVTKAKLRDPFDLSADCCMRADTTTRPARCAAAPPPEFFMEGVSWRVARCHAELIGILDDAGAACSKAMATNDFGGTTWFLRIAVPGVRAAPGFPLSREFRSATKAAAFIAPWTPEQLAGALPPPPTVKGYLNIGYHAQFWTPGELARWGPLEEKSVTALLDGIDRRLAAEEPEHCPVPHHSTMSTQLHASALRHRTGALIVAVHPDRCRARSSYYVPTLVARMNEWVPRSHPAW